MKVEKYRCDNCGKIELVPIGKRRWCDCNPTAKFEMRSVAVGKVVDNALRKYLAKIGAKGGAKSRRVLTPEQARAMQSARAQTKMRK